MTRLPHQKNEVSNSTMTNDIGNCPECGDAYNSKDTFAPGEGPNRSDDTVVCYYHDDYRMCTRLADADAEA